VNTKHADTVRGSDGSAHTHVQAGVDTSAWDHSTHEQFYDYYASESISNEARVRFCRIRDHILRFVPHAAGTVLDVADIGCGAGSHSIVWAEKGHRVHALDVNERLLDLGRERASQRGLDIDFRVGTATRLPWADESVDVCVAIELLEHVEQWGGCMNEFTRILRPGGAVFVSTTNQLCPKQAEFNLPMYSWYPAPVKRHYEKLAFTTRPELANYAKYPAVHWFTFYQLRKWLLSRGCRSLDRFDIMDMEEKGAMARLVVSAMRSVPLLRWFGHVCTPGTVILGIKQPAVPGR
jgi:2-polyprenyl-3-methyl-5-hydroxy-6-metoxy-1,4-benzoquinol methylase